MQRGPLKRSASGLRMGMPGGTDENIRSEGAMTFIHAKGSARI